MKLGSESKVKKREKIGYKQGMISNVFPFMDITLYHTMTTLTSLA